MRAAQANIVGIVAGLLALLFVTAAFSQQVQTRDWALYKTLYANGSMFFAPIVGIGGVPIAVGFSNQTSQPVMALYVDRNTYRRDGNIITFDLLWQSQLLQGSRLYAGSTIDCATRTYFWPTAQKFKGPMDTGEASKIKSYMKKPKVSGDFTAEDVAYFCEGPSPAPIPSTKPGD